MNHTDDPRRIRWAWLAAGIVFGPLSALMLAPYFVEWRHAGACAVLGVLAMGGGLWEKYRSSLGCRHTLFHAAPRLVGMLLLLALGGVGALLLVIKRTDLIFVCGVLASLTLAASFAIGMWRAMRTVRLYPPQDKPEWLLSRVDLERGILLLPPFGGTATATPWWYGLALAFGLNFHLLWQAFGFEQYSFVTILVPVVLGVLATFFSAAGHDAVYLWQILKLERRLGRRFQAPHLEEVRALRRTFWFAKWLCRPEDLVQPQTPSTQHLTRKERRKVRAAGASAR